MNMVKLHYVQNKRANKIIMFIDSNYSLFELQKQGQEKKFNNAAIKF